MIINIIDTLHYIMKRPFFIAIYGPTAVGKTDFVLHLAQRLNGEIINMDVGQLYTPLTIGTAKPDWKNFLIPHHMFDVQSTPKNFSVTQYRDAVLPLIHTILARKKIPILVGGSGFYLYSLLFPPLHPIVNTPSFDNNIIVSWDTLHQLDPVRAQSIHPHDTYRIERAINIIKNSHLKPSLLAPCYNPIADFLLIYLSRDVEELKKRIYERIMIMLNQGWIEEAQSLIDSPWHSFLQTKKLIGYNDLFDLIHKKISYNQAIDLIYYKTCQYAKRQRTLWRKIDRDITYAQSITHSYIGCIESLNLSCNDYNHYTEQLCNRFFEKI